MNEVEELQVFPVTDLKCHLLILPYQGQKDDVIIKSMNKILKTLLPDNIKTVVAFEDKQLSFCFNVKNKVSA